MTTHKTLENIISEGKCHIFGHQIAEKIDTLMYFDLNKVILRPCI